VVAPSFDLRRLSTDTFALAIVGASLWRTVVGAVPVLLPLRFLVGFGWEGFMLVLAMFAVSLAL
jgi:hypothetical protein